MPQTGGQLQGWIAPPNLAQALTVFGPQYGANKVLGLEDLGMQGLSLLDQLYLAHMGMDMFPQDPGSTANWNNWLSTMQTMHPEMLTGTPWAAQQGPGQQQPVTNPVTDPQYPPHIGGINTGAGYSGNPQSLQTANYTPPQPEGEISRLMLSPGTFGQGLEMIGEQIRADAKSRGFTLPETRIPKSPLADYLSQLGQNRLEQRTQRRAA